MEMRKDMKTRESKEQKETVKRKMETPEVKLRKFEKYLPDLNRRMIFLHNLNSAGKR